MRVLFLCLGNICRSPLAEGAFEAWLRDRGTGEGVTLDSAGLGGWHVGRPPDRRSIQVAAEHGIDISGQRARQLVAEDFQRFDWIVAMDEDNRREAEALRPKGEGGAKVIGMRAYLPEGRKGDGVPDPYYGEIEGFREVWELLQVAFPALEAALRG